MTTLHLGNSINRSPLGRGLLFIPLALCCFALSPAARADDDDRGNGNTAEGSGALASLTTGSANTANGYVALYDNTTGRFNTATGFQALLRNNGNNNTANGANALFNNTTGSDNTANGFHALFSNTTGPNNTATGHNALYSNNAGADNTATGNGALYSNTTGYFNTANGFRALYSNTAGINNTANGFQALFSNTTGHDNTAIGLNALNSNTTGSSNIALGVAAGDSLTTGSNNIDIGNLFEGGAGESDTIRIGRVGTQTATFIAGIDGATVASGVGVIIDSNGHLGTVVSSERFKDQIKPMDKASEVILALKPVTFRYKHELDPEGIPQFGLVAEQVEKVNPNLVARDSEGKVYTVRYEAVNAMLLNEFLKEHRKVEEQEVSITELKTAVAKQEATTARQQKDFQSTIAQQQKGMEALTASLKEQALQIRKVSDQLELSKATPQMAGNDR